MDYSSPQNIGQIISSLSHELRTPITILSSNLQLLKNKHLLMDEEMRSESFMLCEEALRSVTGFLEGIHFINLANKNEVQKNVSTIKTDEFIEKITNSKSSLFYKSDRIKISEHSHHTTFNSDEHLLIMAVTQLLDNAYKFSAKDVILTISSDDKFVNVTIEDSGVGIPKDKLESIFLPFYRCEEVKMISGIGLGLPIAQKAIERLNGTIEIKSSLSEGTKVEIKVPVNE
ncbi:HAMP domain-containing sensor histidine kinase [uncultured Sunxiuqinia sp.]|uniref:sensor histidine kinase n=1 Tax=uncultured Sunxiuqinia sp. TaxID=1573825 RepID=UPI002AA88A58|nr:HAMP domain-containing sensor histidine kinase [uncultured Sunxiuqinia sp.]